VKAVTNSLIALVAVAACARGPEVAIVAPDGSVRAVVKVELADTPATREMGLMYRRELAVDAGMLFVFPAPLAASFWMKNTPLPLDMIFADATGRVIGMVEGAEPFSERTVGVQGLSKYVLEVNAGAGARIGVRPGDRLDFRGFTPEARD
jgi:hypothetical protein